MLAWIATALFVTTSLNPGSAVAGTPRVAPTTLVSLTHSSETIFVGTTLRVRYVNADGSIATEKGRIRERSLRVAELGVDRLVRGPESLETVWILAQRTWACDESDAVEGEQALWFLDAQATMPGVRSEGSRAFDWAPPSAQARRSLLRLTGGKPLQRIAWAGWGRIVLEEREGELIVPLSWGVRPPSSEHVPGAPDPEGQSRSWGRPVDEVVRWMHRFLRVSPHRLPLHPFNELPAEEALFVEGRVLLAQWEDGTLVWSQDPVRGGASFRIGSIDLDRRVALRNSFRAHEPLHTHAQALQAGATPHAPRAGRLAVTRWGNAPVCVAIPDEATDPIGIAAKTLEERMLALIPKDGGEPASFGALERERLPGDQR